MGPVVYTGGVWLPVGRPDLPTQGELERSTEKDRSGRRGQQQRRRHQEQEDPDGDQYTHSPEEPASE